MRDEHRHCSCNGVWLCSTCHQWAHAHPFEARSEGLIVSRHEESPGRVPAEAWYGPVELDCAGNVTIPGQRKEEDA